MSSTGAIIMGLFAAIWWVVGVRASGYASPLTYLIPLIVTGLIIVISFRFRDRPGHVSPEEEARRNKLVGIASGIEGVAMFVAANVLINVGWSEYVAPAMAIIVGLHFLPLARRLPAPLYYATSALLIALGIGGLEIGRQELRILIVSIGAACILWLTCIAVLVRIGIMNGRSEGLPGA